MASLGIEIGSGTDTLSLAKRMNCRHLTYSVLDESLGCRWTGLQLKVGSDGPSSVDECKVGTFASSSAGAEGSTAISDAFPASSDSASNLTEMGVRASPWLQGSLQTPPMRNCFLLHHSFQSQNSS